MCGHGVSGCPAGLRLNPALRAAPPEACSPTLCSSAGRTRGRARTPNRHPREWEQGSPLPQKTTAPPPRSGPHSDRAPPLFPPPSAASAAAARAGAGAGYVTQEPRGGRAGEGSRRWRMPNRAARGGGVAGRQRDRIHNAGIRAPIAPHSPPPVDAHVGRAGEPGVQDVDAADRVGALDALPQRRVVVEPQPLAEPVHGVHPHAAGAGWGRGRSAGTTAAARGAAHHAAPPLGARASNGRRRPARRRGRAARGPRGLASVGSRTRRRRRGRPPGADASPRGAPAPGRAETENGRAGSGGRSGAVEPPPHPREAAVSTGRSRRVPARSRRLAACPVTLRRGSAGHLAPPHAADWPVPPPRDRWPSRF